VKGIRKGSEGESGGCFVFMHCNRRMKPVEIVVRRGQRGKEGEHGGGESN
jgi:hypothetical protein